MHMSFGASSKLPQLLTLVKILAEADVSHALLGLRLGGFAVAPAQKAGNIDALKRVGRLLGTMGYCTRMHIQIKPLRYESKKRGSIRHVLTGIQRLPLSMGTAGGKVSIVNGENK